MNSETRGFTLRVRRKQTLRRGADEESEAREKEMEKEMDKARKEAPIFAEPKPDTTQFTLDNAFSPYLVSSESTSLGESSFQIERGIRAVALLLDQSTEEGGDTPVKGSEVAGLASVLVRYADDIASLRRRLRRKIG
jgi:hypothetical protein